METATKGRFRSRLALALEEGKPFTISLPTLVEDPSIDLFSVPKRYQEDQLAPHVIGYLDSQGRGAAGIELAMDDLLAGFSGEVSVTYQVDALGRVIAGADRQVVDTLSGSRGGVGIRNIMKRLWLCYGDQASFVVSSRAEEGTRMEIRFPRCAPVKKKLINWTVNEII